MRSALHQILLVFAFLLLTGSFITWVATSTATAQDLEPRAYTNTPVGLNFLLAGYVYQEGEVATDPSLPFDDASLHVHSAVLAYARSLSLLGKSAKVDVIVPYSWLDGSATFQGESVERIVDGFADPRFRLSVNLYGAPALALDEFANYQQDVIVGVSLQFSPPLGQYDPDRLVNIGSNRWAFKPELGVSKAFGPLILEVAPSIILYTDNDDFLGTRSASRTPSMPCRRTSSTGSATRSGARWTAPTTAGERRRSTGWRAATGNRTPAWARPPHSRSAGIIRSSSM